MSPVQLRFRKVPVVLLAFHRFVLGFTNYSFVVQNRGHYMSSTKSKTYTYAYVNIIDAKTKP